MQGLSEQLRSSAFSCIVTAELGLAVRYILFSVASLAVIGASLTAGRWKR